MNNRTTRRDNVYYLKSHRETINPAYDWQNDIRVSHGGKRVVKAAAAFLLASMEVDPVTLQVGAAGFAIFPFNPRLLTDDDVTAEEFRIAVRTKVTNVIGIEPLLSVIRSEKRDNTKAWLIYIL